MSAIFGVIDPKHDPGNRETILRISESLLCREPWMHLSSAQHGSALLGVVDIGVEKGLIETDDLILVFCGNIVNDEDGNGPPSISESVRLLLTKYQANGIDGLTHLNGLFVIAIWDKNKKLLFLINNQIGIQKCYYAVQDQCFYFSSEYKTIAALPHFRKSINPQSISEWFVIGYQLQEKTFFNEINALPAATILRFEHGEARLSTYWEPAYYEVGNPKLTEDEYIDGFADLFKQSVLRRISPNTHLLLSGGIDSRTILGFSNLVSPQTPIVSNTMGSENCQDVQIAKKLSNKFDIQHTHIPVGLDYFERYAHQGVIRCEGYLRAFESWILAENLFLEKHQPARIMLGLLGNVLNGRYWPEGNISDETVVIDHLLKRKSLTPILSNILKPEYVKLFPTVFENLANLYTQAPYQTPVRKLDYVNLRLGNHRHAATPDTLADHAFYYEPFMDLDLVEFCNAIPVDLLHKGYILKSAIQRYIPEITEIGYYSPIFPLKYALYLDKRNLWDPLLSQYRRIVRRLRFPHNDNPFGYVFPNQALRTASRNFVLETISEKEVYADFLEPDAVYQFVEDHYQRKNNNYYSISSILTFIHWLKYFLTL